jgi:hypothetical protein
MTKGRLNKLGLLALIILLPYHAIAHEIRPALIKLTQASVTEYQLVFKQPQVQGRFLNLSVSTNCEHSEGDRILGRDALQTISTVNCERGPLGWVSVPGIEGTLIDAMLTIEPLNGPTQNLLISARSPTYHLSPGATVPAYLVLGVEHLVFGIDHVLFVLLLLYLVRGFKNLLKVITSFTIAHSITLGLSAFQLVSVSQAPVEALIALSIAVLALEAFRPDTSLVNTYPWLMTFCFGLLHGLGFAGALNTIGLPETSLVSALFLFNVGIEIGQLALIVVVLGSVALIGPAAGRIPAPLVRVPLYLIGGTAVFWFIDRTLPILV